MQTILAGPVAIEGAKQASLLDVECIGCNFSAVHRRIHVTVVLGFSHIHIELAETHFDILVASYIAHVELSSHHPHVERRRLGHLYGYLEVVVRATGDADFGLVACYGVAGNVLWRDRQLEDAAWLLFDQALLLEGIPLKDPAAFVQRLNRVLNQSI